jgi:hypothetical protein
VQYLWESNKAGAMSIGKPEMLELFGKWHFSKNALLINGIITILGALLINASQNFYLGEFFNGGRYIINHLLSAVGQKF